MCDKTLTWLQAELSSFPDRTPQDEFYDYFLSRVGEVIGTERSALVPALAVWLRSRPEPRTMLALKVAAAYHLAELRPEVERLLDDVLAGKALLPYYSRYVTAALDNL